MARTLKITYEQMPEPKYVIAMGACAVDGGIFYNSYNIVRPDKIVPVDFYIPGCPPRPEAVTNALYHLQKKIRKHRIASKRVIEGPENERGNY